MNEPALQPFIETKQYLRFVEFCDACRRHRYIGICYGAPGVGKTRSARHYSRADQIGSYVERYRPNRARPSTGDLNDIAGHDIVFYTAAVLNSPKQISTDISRLRHDLLSLVRQQISVVNEEMRASLQRREKEEHDKWYESGSWFTEQKPNQAEREYLKACVNYTRRYGEAQDPTRLIIVDEANHLKVAGLEQLRAIFDRGGIGLIFMGMEGIEKQLARYPQLYSRVGFVHEFKVLAETEARSVLKYHQWRLAGVVLPSEALSDDTCVAAILRITGCNFRLLDKLLTQISRVLEVNQLDKVTPAVVELARTSLVIGTA